MKLGLSKYRKDWQKIGEMVNRTAPDCQAFWSQHPDLFASIEGGEDPELILESLETCSKDTIKVKRISLKNVFIYIAYDLQEMCRIRTLGVSGSKETLSSRLRLFLFENAALKEEERKILTEFAKKSPNRRDFKAAVQRLEEKGYERGLREVFNLLQHLFPEVYTKDEMLELNDFRPTGVRSSRLEKEANQDQTAYATKKKILFFFCFLSHFLVMVLVLLLGVFLLENGFWTRRRNQRRKKILLVVAAVLDQQARRERRCLLFPRSCQKAFSIVGTQPKETLYRIWYLGVEKSPTQRIDGWMSSSWLTLTLQWMSSSGSRRLSQ